MVFAVFFIAFPIINKLVIFIWIEFERNYRIHKKTFNLFTKTNNFSIYSDLRHLCFFDRLSSPLNFPVYWMWYTYNTLNRIGFHTYNTVSVEHYVYYNTVVLPEMTACVSNTYTYIANKRFSNFSKYQNIFKSSDKEWIVKIVR